VEDMRTKAQTQVRESSEKKESKTKRLPEKKRSEKIESKREDPQYNEEIRRERSKIKKRGEIEWGLGNRTTGDL
jgi:hypothetical protein